MSATPRSNPTSPSEFAKLLDETLGQNQLHSGDLVKATVIQVDDDVVIVNAGLKSEAVISISEFYDEKGNIEVKEGDVIDVVIDSLEDGFGETRLSREKARRAESWEVLEVAHKANETVMGIVAERVKGGFTVEIRGVRAFLPG